VGQPDYSEVTLDSLALNLLVMALMFAAFMAVGTAMFVRKERNR
jgi:hypothetical protein